MRFISLILTAIFVLPVATMPNVIRVPRDGATIQAGVDMAESGDTILVADGAYTGPWNRGLILYRKSLAFISENGPANTRIDCGGADGGRFIYFGDNSPISVIDGFTFTNFIGSAISAAGVETTIRNCIFTKGIGPAIGLNGAKAILEYCTIAHNEGTAIRLVSDAGTVIRNCQIVNNGNVVPIDCYDLSYWFVDIHNTNIYGHPIGDWAECTRLQDQVNGNMSVDPIFCDPASMDFHLRENSPLNPDSLSGRQIGALGVGCIEGTAPVASNLRVEPLDSLGFVSTDRPTLRWDYLDSTQSTQAGYLAEIGPDLYWRQPLVWSSGENNSGETYCTPSDVQFDNATTYFVRVRLASSEGWGPWRTTQFSTHFRNTIWVPQEKNSIQAGIDVARNGDTVLVDDGVYGGPGNEDIDLVGKAIVLMSRSGPEHTILRPSPVQWPSSRALVVTNGEDSTTIIDGFTVTGFKRNVNAGLAGAMLVMNSSPTIRNCVFYDNYMHDYMHQMAMGGAIHFSNSNSSVDNCTFVKNVADFGSAVDCARSPVVFSSCLFAFNTGNYFISWDFVMTPNYEFQPQMINCDFYGNDPINDILGQAYPFFYDNKMVFDPLFCDLEQGNLSVRSDSPCLPENNEFDLLLGALGRGCTATDVLESDDNQMPLTYALSQNYPNPFNPNTTIEFTLAKGQEVRLEVFNVLGRSVAVLVDSYLPAGRHELAWNGRSDQGQKLSSGVYLYRFKTAISTDTKKMVLAK